MRVMSQVSNDKLLEVLLDIKGEVGEIKGKVGGFSDHDERLRRVENRQHWYSGAGAVLGAIAGALGMHLKIT